MKVKRYRSPEKTGWFGWIENAKGRALAFIKLDGSIVWDW